MLLNCRITFLLAISVSKTVAVAVAVAVPKISVTRTNSGGTYAPGDLIFQDEFDSLNKNKWHHEINMAGGGNNEQQIYDTQAQNAYVRAGILYIRPSLTLDKLNGSYEELYNGYLELENCTDTPGTSACKKDAKFPNILPPAYSARLRTKGTFSFRYGKVQVKAKLPSGDWTWPAIWMLPESKVYGAWPNSGEVDIMEGRGNQKLFAPSGQNVGSEKVSSTLHFGPGWPHNGNWAAHGERNTPTDQGYDRDYHVFELEWTPEFMQFRVDGNILKTVNPPSGGFFELGKFPSNVTNPWIGADNFHMAPFDQNFHLILNVAVGGGFFASNTNPTPPWVNSGKPPFLSFMDAVDTWKKTWVNENHAMKVDYVRVYAV